MPVLNESSAARMGESVSAIFNDQKKMEQNQNLALAMIIGRNPNYNREPDYWLYLYNISPRTYVRERPPDFPRIPIMACPPGDAFILAAKIPNIINYKWTVPDTGQAAFDSIDGERFACDLVNPANLGREMWNEVTNDALQSMHGSGDDLSIRGVFWSKNDVPEKWELDKARARMEVHYRRLVQDADALAHDPKTVREIGPEHHIAADYLRVSANWHVTTVTKEVCPNCGDEIARGIAFHQSTTGIVCVLDWKRAVAAGARKREDVPEEHQWWGETGAEPGDEPEKPSRRRR